METQSLVTIVPWTFIATILNLSVQADQQHSREKAGTVGKGTDTGTGGPGRGRRLEGRV